MQVLLTNMKTLNPFSFALFLFIVISVVDVPRLRNRATAQINLASRIIYIAALWIALHTV